MAASMTRFAEESPEGYRRATIAVFFSERFTGPLPGYCMNSHNKGLIPHKTKIKWYNRCLNIPSTSSSIIRIIIFISSHEKCGINYETMETRSFSDDVFCPKHHSLFLWRPGYDSPID